MININSQLLNSSVKSSIQYKLAETHNISMNNSSVPIFCGYNLNTGIKNCFKKAKGYRETNKVIADVKKMIKFKNYDQAITDLVPVIKLREKYFGRYSKTLIKPLELIKFSFVKKSDGVDFKTQVDILTEALHIDQWIDKIKYLNRR